MSGNYGVYHKYFVLKPRGESLHAAASRAAMLTFAAFVAEEQPHMAADIRQWVHEENRHLIRETSGEVSK